MTTRRSAFLIAVGIAFVAYLFWYFSSSEPPQRPQISLKGPPPNRQVPRIRDDSSWNTLSERELREFVSYFDDKPHHTISKLDTLVAENETVITAGHESEPGVFTFSTLTPRVTTRSDGKTVIEVMTKTTETSLSGGVKTLFSKRIDLISGKNQEAIVATKEGIHFLAIEAEADRQYPLIKMKATSSFEKDNR